MNRDIQGLDHVSTIANSAAKNVAFYTQLLGLRMVKRTVNFDAPNHYHLYYGDRVGTPGSLITFFPGAANRVGVPGTGEVDTTHFAVPAGALDYWQERLRGAFIATARQEGMLRFRDGNQTRLTLTETPATGDGHAIARLAGVTIVVQELTPTSDFLMGVLGFERVESAGNRTRFHTPGGPSGGWIEVVVEPKTPHAVLGFGSVHHVAWRVRDEAAQLRVREAIAPHVHGLTEVRDRLYFRSIYFREPGGVIFEIATDGPGFLIDEDEATLGTTLKLPPQVESQRQQIEPELEKLEMIP